MRTLCPSLRQLLGIAITYAASQIPLWGKMVELVKSMALAGMADEMPGRASISNLGDTTLLYPRLSSKLLRTTSLRDKISYRLLVKM